MTSTALPAVSVRIDASTVTGAFTALHGVNNGPICFGGLVDLTEWQRRLDLPAIRLHDSGWPGPVVVDLPMIFPDFHADPEDPANYRFDKTDDYLHSLLPVTGKIVYRLGTSIEWTRRKYDTDPPVDFDHWARICIGLIRHMNEGWADGHHLGIRHFEIWNEPDLGDRMWSGTQQQYLELYTVAARAIKAHDPSLLVGGPVVAHVDGDLPLAFVKHVTENDVPLDFFDWHHYAVDPEGLAARARAVRDLLDAHGLGHVESYLTEWAWGGDWSTTSEGAKRIHQRNRSARGAAFVASSLIQLQDAGLDEAHYFSGDTQWFGLFDEFGIPHKHYYGMLAASQLSRRDHRVAVEVQQTESTRVTAAAGTGTDGLVAVVSAYEGEDAELRLLITGLPADERSELRLHVIDEHHDLDVVERIVVSGTEVEIVRGIPRGSVLMVSNAPEA